jgi:hypothetical protein
LPPHGTDFFAPKSNTEVQELANLIALGEWAPDSFRDGEGSYAQPKIELAILQGSLVGLNPIAAVQSIAVIDGMPTIWGDGALALVENSGLLEDMQEEFTLDETEGLTAICTIRRRHRPTPITNRFSMAMAEQAQLTQKEGPWQLYPQRMLRMRARSWTLRDGFADVLRGLHIREEVEDFANLKRPFAKLPRPTAAPQPGRVSPQSRRPVARDSAAPGERRDIQPAANVAADAGQPPLGTDAAMASIARDRRASKEMRDREGRISVARKEVAAIEANELDQSEAIGVTRTAAASRSSAGVGASEQQSNFVLVDADGCVGEVASIEELRSEFERLLLDEHLAPAEVFRLWVVNEPARTAIERHFGTDVFVSISERVAAAEKACAPSIEAAPPAAFSRLVHKSEPSISTDPVRPGGPAGREPDFELRIDPTWGDRKIFHYYRATLAALHKKGAASHAHLEAFRAVNKGIEARLRSKLPGWIEQLDALYANRGSGPSPC